MTMNRKILPAFSGLLLCLLSGCGLDIYEDWQASGGKAIVGAGAVAGKDYINGLLPSENSRKYFTQISANSDQPIETVSRTDDSSSKSGVRFVKNGGIVIPPGTMISYTNKGYCMDPNLPAPKSGEEFQLVPMAQLIPEELQGTYKKLLEKASSGDTSVQFNMQHLIWALRTAGTDAAYANNLTTQQKHILDRCSDYQGQFEDFHATAKSNSKMMKELLGLADSYLNVKIGGVSYKASDLLDPDIGSKKINEHLNQLIDMSKYLPVENTGFNYGELQPGIYTDVKGSGSLQFTARIANSTNQPFVYYPQNFVGQVGSGSKSQGFIFFATANSSMRQRTTQGVPEKIAASLTPLTNIQNKTLDYHNDLSENEQNKFLKYLNIAIDSYNNLSSYDEDGVRCITPYELGGEELARLWQLAFTQYLAHHDGGDLGLSAALYKDKNGDIILAFRGTDNWEDSKDYVQIVMGRRSTQQRWGIALVKMVSQYSEKGLIVTGHSLGGYLAVASSLSSADKISAIYAYNAPGVDRGLQNEYLSSDFEKYKISSKIYNIYNKNDAVHTFNTDSHDLLGSRIEITQTAGFGDWINSWGIRAGFFHNHYGETMKRRMEKRK